ncbi:5,10-methylenetetrahydrofolate reductase (NAD(P)) [Moraxella cuniculi DSM 21768]|uniref:Methylenetetrahydrofolate reductase n=2 Tax=Moraxella cuniculi TaxID=34061 RepID=A0A1N7ESF0_9GAMM|nr:methylenetetrahydrofolate reductase [NAD(P)H] [Moraxella cuniculi]OOS06316.1 methylenetetrahydrofolate reductase [NAD(P)H] [Moraxella cuniculi]SIR90954.1 5,10-methylenetetrahydrofolate reductase (NAD(P)) [Moraxella cuniculi DSM 21768]VEG13385.1 5,10-methylenetetrahydrofolate reductase [Moraxella cuniculi]
MTQSLLNRLNDIETLLNSVKSELQNQTKPNNTNNKVPFSFEFFPTKTDEAQDKLLTTFDTLNALNPQYFSVTYGAGGSTRERTLGIVEALSKQSDTPIAPHMSCIGDTKAEIGELLDFYKSLGVTRVVALRGDLPSGQVGYGELPYALDLVKFIRQHSGEHFTIKVAAYPEMHPQARNFDADIDNLVAKYHAGANEAITQFFYNADSYLFLRDKLAKKGVHQDQFPIIAGIMPITNASNIIRFADGCGADIPRYIRKQLADFGDDRKAIRQFGFEVVHTLCQRLIREGVPALHFYSMNSTEPNKELVKALGLTS